MAEREAKLSSLAPPVSEPKREAPAPSAGSPFKIYKPGQGQYVRWGSAVGGLALALFGVAFIRDELVLLRLADPWEVYVRNLVPALLLAAAGYFIFWAVGRNERICEFMIATEGEMKKVNWSSRREVWGATRVVIFTVVMLGLILAIVDLAFILLFSGIGVLRMHILERLFGNIAGGGG